MNQEAIGYNNGRYDFRQQTFCLSMLTCLSFNLPGFSTAAITRKFRTFVENALNNDTIRKLIGEWDLVYGPVVYADAFVGSMTPVNSLFIAVPRCDPGQAVVAIAGTNGSSLLGWMVEDFNVKEKIPWPYGDTHLQPHITKGLAYGLGKLQGLEETKSEDGIPMTAVDYLASNPRLKNVMVTGHSIGGTLATALSLYLEDTRQDWNPDGSISINCLNTAGPSPGDEDFSKYYGERLGAVTSRVWNSMDIVSHAFENDKLGEIPGLYEPNLQCPKRIAKFITNLRTATLDNRYLNVLPDAEGFPSTYLKLEDVTGEKYKVFTEFINSVQKLVKRLLPFGGGEATGSVSFVVHALLQHIFPYIYHFGVDDFIAVMNSPAVRSTKAKASAPS